jgi:hypothetical protein
MTTYTRDQCFTALSEIVEGLSNGGDMMTTPTAVCAKYEITDQAAFQACCQQYALNESDDEYLTAFRAFDAAGTKAAEAMMAVMNGGEIGGS